MFQHIPPVTKNILLLNITIFIVALFLASRGMDLHLESHYVNSPLFKPYQMITHMFMHSKTDFLHIVFNMFLLVSFGSHLERIWGPKRFFLFYMASGIGAFMLYNAMGVIQIMELKQNLIQIGYDMDVLNHQITQKLFDQIQLLSNDSQYIIQEYISYSYSSMVGASGAIFGLLAGFAILFPNTELMLLFPPIPIKAKYLIGGYLIFEIYNSIYNTGDSIAHLAHVGGAIVGIALVLYWRKTDRNHFY